MPGLNPAVRAVTLRAVREGYRVLGIRRGWRGLVDVVPNPDVDNSDAVVELTPELVRVAGRTGGTFLHSSRTRPSHLPKVDVPEHLGDTYQHAHAQNMRSVAICGDEDHRSQDVEYLSAVRNRRCGCNRPQYRHNSGATKGCQPSQAETTRSPMLLLTHALRKTERVGSEPTSPYGRRFSRPVH